MQVEAARKMEWWSNMENSTLFCHRTREKKETVTVVVDDDAFLVDRYSTVQ
jgi:hypothetical protein